MDPPKTATHVESPGARREPLGDGNAFRGGGGASGPWSENKFHSFCFVASWKNMHKVCPAAVDFLEKPAGETNRY